MKKLLFLPLLMITFFCFAQDAEKTIGSPIKIGNFVVAQNDLPYSLTFEEAKKACAKLGKGWRLPTKVELNTMYLNERKITAYGGGFAETYYFSSTIYPGLYAWRQDFTNGHQGGYSSYEQYGNNVRAINSLPSVVATSVKGDISINIGSVIGKTISIEKLVVAQNDFPNLMTWTEAKAACKKLGKGWRLPTFEELETLYKYRDKVPNWIDDYYWSSSEGGEGFRSGWLKNFGSGSYGLTDKKEYSIVRAVKTL